MSLSSTQRTLHQAQQSAQLLAALHDLVAVRSRVVHVLHCQADLLLRDPNPGVTMCLS